jgi:hypothetical protein
MVGRAPAREVAAIEVADLHPEPQGLHIDLPCSKTNEEGDEEYVLVHRGSDPNFCAVRAVEAWQAALLRAGIVEVASPSDRHRFERDVRWHGVEGAKERLSKLDTSRMTPGQYGDYVSKRFFVESEGEDDTAIFEAVRQLVKSDVVRGVYGASHANEMLLMMLEDVFEGASLRRNLPVMRVDVVVPASGVARAFLSAAGNGYASTG